MTREVSIQHQDLYVSVHVGGDPLTPGERRSMLTKVLEEAATLNVDIVIHEDTLGLQPLTPVEYFGRANYLATSPFKNRIAYVPPAEMPPDTRQLITNAAQNEGHVVKLFSQVDDAVRWIEAPSDA